MYGDPRSFGQRELKKKKYSVGMQSCPFQLRHVQDARSHTLPTRSVGSLTEAKGIKAKNLPAGHNRLFTQQELKVREEF